ncbi:MAG: hypothetical protein BMS9Abin34_416 [Patescibacteria group bacterium]|nr:MAG: hypothetical protein BMS9Abin34_416 [Patescibacteria group bacterium]
MLPKENRLSSSFDFQRIRRLGRRGESPFFSFFVLREYDRIRPPRFGFVVSAKVSKRATKRNRIRRVLQDEVGRALPRIQPGVSGVFWMKARALQSDPQELRAQVRKVLQKAGVLPGRME